MNGIKMERTITVCNENQNLLERSRKGNEIT